MIEREARSETLYKQHKPRARAAFQLHATSETGTRAVVVNLVKEPLHTLYIRQTSKAFFEPGREFGTESAT
jgi:hypothetical protein